MLTAQGFEIMESFFRAGREISSWVEDEAIGFELSGTEKHSIAVNRLTAGVMLLNLLNTYWRECVQAFSDVYCLLPSMSSTERL